MSNYFYPIVFGLAVMGSSVQSQSLGGFEGYSKSRKYEQGTVQGFSHFGEAGYRYSGDAPKSGKIRLVGDFFTGQYGFGVTGGGQVQFFDSKKWNKNRGNATVWEGDGHAYYEFREYITVGGYYAYEGSNDVNDFQYYGGEAMLTMSSFNFDAKLGLADNADGKGHGTAYEVSGFYDFTKDFSAGAGYGRIDANNHPDYQRAFGRVNYGGIIPSNNIGVFAEVSYVDFDDGRDDTSIAAGIQWGLGRNKEVGRRVFRKPNTLLDF